ncbi:dephospho-CoA kinase [Burkholderia dolosa]|uniref:dephospho-CoA kinase n=1 Tax=Burkholderia dolosa TaxID=152500 RepID=UPI000454E70B|nr:dephospho-CoA kinase [Burkholderia dolosa]ETP66490.1 dephospho-CoA kinase [Burkholderia dolosa PC543]
MFSIGLTGGIGSGKTTVADLFGVRGASIVDTDLIAHRITAPGGLAMPAIEQAFGRGFVAPDGSLERAARRRCATRSRDACSAHRSAYVMFVVPLLVESGTWKARTDRVLVVDCAVETQIERVMRRNGFTREQVEAIIARQATREARLAAADDVIVNDATTPDTLAAQVDALHQRYLGLAAAAR